jgi:hypothetical protein
VPATIDLPRSAKPPAGLAQSRRRCTPKSPRGGILGYARIPISNIRRAEATASAFLVSLRRERLSAANRDYVDHPGAVGLFEGNPMTSSEMSLSAPWSGGRSRNKSLLGGGVIGCTVRNISERPAPPLKSSPRSSFPTSSPLSFHPTVSAGLAASFGARNGASGLPSIDKENPPALTGGRF